MELSQYHACVPLRTRSSSWAEGSNKATCSALAPSSHTFICQFPDSNVMGSKPLLLSP